jgi:hypothetical protein
MCIQLSKSGIYQVNIFLSNADWQIYSDKKTNFNNCFLKFGILFHLFKINPTEIS